MGAGEEVGTNGHGAGMPVLPREAYTDQAWFDREQRAIFSNTWAFAGFAEDIREPGDYKAVQAGQNNLLLVMGRDRRLRAFHNLCRHRGTQLLRAVGKAERALTCPYHDWTYDLEGNLISVPEQATEFPNLDRKCFGLHRASVDIWRSMIWVHPDPDAGSIMRWFGEIEPWLGPHRPDELVEYEPARIRHEVAANWKIVVENYIDAYHLARLHAGTLSMYDHARIQSGFVGPHFAFWEPLSPEYEADLENNAALPLIDHVPRHQMGAWVPMLFPSLGLAESECTWSTFHVIPVAPDRSIIESRTRLADVSSWTFAKQAWTSAAFWRRHIRGKYGEEHRPPQGYGAEQAEGKDPLLSGDFFAEDNYVCEQQQKALASPRFSVGPTAEKGEKAVRQFQQLVWDWVQGEPLHAGPNGHVDARRLVRGKVG